jgi:restriction system protein
VTANRASFEEFVLDSTRLDPALCLDFLGADRSKHPMALAPVEPFVDFDAAQYRLDAAAESIEVADGEVLLEMDPYDFEGLVRDLFEAMGYRAWRTQPSHDDGIDAVAVTDHRFTPVGCVIQVKRVRRAVPPHYVQALMGAMAEHGTATHGVLVTTSWLSDRSRQRARAQRIQIIDGSELPALILQYLGRRVVVARDDGSG